ncbi:MAG: CoA pyrophosphatase [Cypionkella sp.]|nr:CoA pyrophosphatase [Cypionkella sp.]
MRNDIADITKAIARARVRSSDFDLNAHVARPARDLRPAAVLMALVQRPAGAAVIFTKRASHLAHHPGQISFPGGKVDAADSSREATALREAREEVGLSIDAVRILGRLPDHETVTGFCMTPVVGVVQGEPKLTVDPAEVAEAFTVPFAHLRHLPNYRVESRRWQGQPRYFYTCPYGPYYIWGATARVLYALARGLADED